MSNGGRLSSEEQNEILKNIGLSLLRSAPNTWEILRLSFSEIGRSGSSEVKVLHQDGSEGVIGVPGDVLMNMSELRGGMYREGVGTWFSATYEVRRPGNFSVDYNYDDEPFLNFMPVNSQYAADLQRFPRSPEATPEWLREKADAAATEEE